MLGCGAWAASKAVSLPTKMLGGGPAAMMKKSQKSAVSQAPRTESSAQAGLGLLADAGFVCYSRPEVLEKGQIERAAAQLEHGMSRSGSYLENSISGAAKSLAKVGPDQFTLKAPCGIYSSDYGWSGGLQPVKPSSSSSGTDPQKFEVSGENLSCLIASSLGFEANSLQKLSGVWNPDDRSGQVYFKLDSQTLRELRSQVGPLVKDQALSEQSVSAIWETLPVTSQRVVLPSVLLKRFTGSYSPGLVDRLALAHLEEWVGVSLATELSLNRTAGLLEQFSRGDLPVSFVALAEPKSSGWFSSKIPAEPVRVDLGQMAPCPGKAAKRIVPKGAIGTGSFQVRAVACQADSTKDECAPQLQTCDWSLFFESDGLRLDYKMSPNGSLADEPNVVAGPELESQHRTKPNLWMGK